MMTSLFGCACRTPPGEILAEDPSFTEFLSDVISFASTLEYIEGDLPPPVFAWNAHAIRSRCFCREHRACHGPKRDGPGRVGLRHGGPPAWGSWRRLRGVQTGGRLGCRGCPGRGGRD